VRLTVLDHLYITDDLHAEDVATRVADAIRTIFAAQ
jgi:hypothetical protein